MKKLDKKGFALVETLIVSVFVMTIFTVIYTSFFPLLGEYERRENYDDIDSVYKTFLFKRMIESDSFNSIGHNNFNALGKNGVYYHKFDSSMCSQVNNSNYCQNLFIETNASKIYYTEYKLTNLRNIIKNNSRIDIDADVKDYINSLPYYSKDQNNQKNLKYRIIVKYKKEIDGVISDENKKTVTSFSTIGVDIS